MQVLYFQTILAWGSFGWILEGSERYWKYGFFAGLFVFLLIVPLITWHYSLVVFLRDRLQRKGLGSIFVALMSAVLFSLCDHWLNFLNVSFGSYLYNRPELLPLARWGGTTLIFFFIILTSELGALIIRGKNPLRWLALPLPIATFVGISVFYFNQIPDSSGTKVHAVAVQTLQLPLWVSKDPSPHLGVLRALSEARQRVPNATFLILPESTFLSPFLEPDSPLAKDRQTLFETPLLKSEIPVFFGYTKLIAENFVNQIYFASVKNDQVDYLGFTKRQPMPFAENFPIQDTLPFLPQLFVQNTMLRAGDQPITGNWQGLQWGALICNEVFFPDLVAELRSQGARILIAIGNEFPIADSSGQNQLLAAATLRAVESDLPLVKSANFGLSFAISNKGQIIQISRPNTEGVFDFEIAPSTTEGTFFSKFPDFFPRVELSFLILAIFGIIWQQRSKRRAQERLH